MNGLGTVPFTDSSITNLTSMAKLVDQGYGIFVNTDVEDAIKVRSPDHKRIIKFERSKNGLYFHDTGNRQVTFLNSQLETSQQYTIKADRTCKGSSQFVSDDWLSKY